MGTLITRDCHTQNHPQCPGYMTRPRPGVLPAITTIHHPNPDQGETLQAEHARCICPCHRANHPQRPALPPTAGNPD